MKLRELGIALEGDERSNKIVLQSEWKSKYKSLIRDEFTLSEKFYRVALMPVSAVMGIAAVFNKNVRTAFKQGTFERTNPTPSQRKDSFFNGMYLAEICAYTSDSIFENSTSEKSNALFLRVFDECHDYNPEHQAGQLRLKYGNKFY